MKFLSYDGLLARIVRYIWNLFVLNICFILCCLPVITIGAAISAMYAVFLNDFRESGVLRKFVGAFAENFKQATVIWLIFMALAAVLAANWYYLLTYSLGGNGLLLAVAAVVSVLYLSVVSFAFALQAKYENSSLQTMKNALILSIGKFFSGVLMMSSCAMGTAWPVALD
jgi:uncharacterized membrane protein YesL